MTAAAEFERAHGPAPDTPTARERHRAEAFAHQARLDRLRGRSSPTGSTHPPDPTAQEQP